MEGQFGPTEEYCATCGTNTTHETWVGCQDCAQKAEREREREIERERAAKRNNENPYDVQKYSWSFPSGTKWETMKVYINTTDKPNYIRFGSDGIEIPLNSLIVSPQKQNYGGLAARNTEGHTDARVFRAGYHKYFLDVPQDMMTEVETGGATVMTESYSPSRGGGKKKRRKYSKKSTKRKSKKKGSKKRRKNTKRRKSKKKTKRRH